MNIKINRNMGLNMTNKVQLSASPMLIYYSSKSSNRLASLKFSVDLGLPICLTGLKLAIAAVVSYKHLVLRISLFLLKINLDCNLRIIRGSLLNTFVQITPALFHQRFLLGPAQLHAS